MRIAELIRERGPLTVAAFIDLALYDSELGYYARAARRSGRAGDFFTSVDVGPVFGELLEIQLAEMSSILAATFEVAHFDLVEAGAGNGRLAADILRAARRRDRSFYESIQLHLVEASAAARAGQPAALGDVNERLASASAAVPASFEGVLLANELLDAFPVHQVVMTGDGLREVYVTTADVARPSQGRNHHGGPDGAALHLIEGPPSTPALAEYLDRLGIALEPGWRVEINLQAVAWIREAARRLRRGFIILIDYGHEARELYSPTHAAGTLTTFARHRIGSVESPPGTPAWLQNPGQQDLTAHVDFTSIRAAAEDEGLTTIALLDQTYFLMGLVDGWSETELAGRAAALKTLMMPGGLGSTHKVMIFGKDVGAPALRGCSFRVRVT